MKVILAIAVFMFAGFTLIDKYGPEFGEMNETLVLDATGCTAYRAMGGKPEALDAGLCSITGKVEYLRRPDQRVVNGIAIDSTHIVATKPAEGEAVRNETVRTILIFYGMLGICVLVLVVSALLIHRRNEKRKEARNA